MHQQAFSRDLSGTNFRFPKNRISVITQASQKKLFKNVAPLMVVNQFF